MLCHVSIKQKRALKVANNNRSSGSQGMQRQEGSNNEPRLRKNENTNQKRFSNVFDGKSSYGMRKITMVEN
jgi:hypothetical protein